jgi:protein-tyrosine-phosphatase
MLWLTGDLLRVADVARAPNDGLPRPSLAAAVGALVRDLVVPHRHALFRLDDPRPAVEELGRAGKRIVMDEGARLAARLLPGWLKLHLRTYRQLEPPARRVYLRRYWQRRLGRPVPAARATPDTRAILFVCHGNIMRSAVAEALMRRSLAGEAAGSAAHVPVVASAGLFARPGREADRRMAAVAPSLGVDLSAHRAQPVTDALIAAADLVVVMDFLNESRMLARFPASAPKLARITDFLPEADRAALGGRVAELADPYHGGMAEVERCAGLVRRATDALTASVVGGGRVAAVQAGAPGRVDGAPRHPELAEPRS